MLLALLLLACAPDPDPEADPAPDDLDGDGYGAAVDCDDGDRLANPAAPELCDGRDNDCDGAVDEDGAVDAPTWYVDVDGDGAGTELVTARACAAPPGFAAARGDCDDADEARSPLLPERCNGVDDDCDLAVDEPDAVDAASWLPDGDGDGFGAGQALRACEAPRGHVAASGDCDDARPEVHPGAEERCDGLDNDCDGLADGPDSVDAAPWFADADGDGFGAGSALVACEPPPGHAPASGDCDEADAEVHPGAAEVCGDGLDNDCDGLADGPDSVDARDWYDDLDGDGWGDPALLTRACEAPAAAVARAEDCDDTEPAVNPDAAEVCGDGLDNDCDGLSGPGCGPGGLRGLAEANARFDGLDAGDGLGGALAPAGDVDGDGLHDLLLGAPGATGLATDDGVVWLLTSSGVGLAGAAGRLIGDDAGDALGVAATGLGDLDGDGVPELAAGAWTHDGGGRDAGAVVLVRGPLAGDVHADDADAVWLGEAAEDYAGGTLAALPDLDGDGWPDLAVGAQGSDRGAELGGAVFLLTDALAGGSLADAEGVLVGESRNDRAGEALTAAGDVDGDGLSDLLIGAWGDDDAGAGAGAAYLALGPSTGTSSLADAEAKLTGEAWYDYAGDAVAGGQDVDGDGYDDLLIGARSNDRAATDAGAAYLFTGPVSGTMDLGRAEAILLGVQDYDYAGQAVAMPGDVNGDGFADLLVGAHYEDAGGNAAGATYLVLGPVLGLRDLADADATYTGEAADDRSGAALSGAGDVDGDGLIDLLIGAPGRDAGGLDAGGVYLVTGGPGL